MDKKIFEANQKAIEYCIRHEDMSYLLAMVDHEQDAIYWMVATDKQKKHIEKTYPDANIVYIDKYQMEIEKDRRNKEIEALNKSGKYFNIKSTDDVAKHITIA